LESPQNTDLNLEFGKLRDEFELKIDGYQIKKFAEILQALPYCCPKFADD